MKRLTKSAIAVLTMASVLTGASQVARASESYPERPVNVIVPFSAGGGSDIIARMLAEGLEKQWDQPLIIVNRPGAGGQVGMQQLARAKPDGYTIGITTSGTSSVNPNIYKELKYDSLEQFEQVSILIDVPFVLVVNPNSPHTDLESWVRHARENPGEVSLGNAGIGSHQYLASHHLAQKAGIELNMIPYSGGPAMTIDLIGNTLDAVLDNTMVQLSFLDNDSVSPLGVSSGERTDFLPDVPTLREAGIPDFQEVAWYGVAAPANTPKEIIDSLQRAMADYLHQPEVTQKLAEMGAMVVGSTPEQAVQRVKSDMGHFGQLVQEIGLDPL